MAWMTKDLALDLLAILIGAGQSAYNRIKDAPGEWPAVEEPAEQSAVAPQQTPTDTPAPETQPQQAPAPQQQEAAPAPEIDAQALLVEAKTLLQSIVASGDREWVTATLLPQFGVAKLSDVPADKLRELIKTAEQKKQEMGQ